jgi:hypothetical protein
MFWQYMELSLLKKKVEIHIHSVHKMHYNSIQESVWIQPNKSLPQAHNL